MAQTKVMLPLSLKVTGSYFLIVGALALIFPFLGPGSSHPEFEAQTFAYKLGSFTREGVLNIAFIIIGASIFGKRSFVPTAVYTLLAIATVYSAYQLAWGVSGGQPSGVVIAGSFGIVGAWNGLWAYLVYRNRAYFSVGKNVERIL